MSSVDEMRWTARAEDDGELSTSSGLPSRAQPREQTMRLARRFVEQIIGAALETRRQHHPSAPEPVVDWELLWAAGGGSASIEQAVGRVVVAAESLARDIAEGRSSRQSRAAVPNAPQRNHRLPGTGSTGTGAVSVLDEADPHNGPDVVAASTGNGVTGQGTAPAPPPVAETDLIEFRPAPPQSSTTAPVGVALTPFLPPSQAVITLPEGLVNRVNARRLRRQRLATLFAWVRNAGFALILFAGWQLWGTSIAQHQAQQSLQQQFTARLHRTPATPTTAATPSLVSADTRVPEPREGSVVARLVIPAIGVDQYVVEGTAENDLQMGPGHYVGTAMPGQAGNVAIAGHRTTYGAPFNNLNQMAPGDAIDLTTDSGATLDYVVTQAPVAVAPSDVKILNSFADNRLTLTTCNPRYSATQRLVVVALLRTPVAPVVVAPSAPVAQAHSQRRIVADGGSMGWNLSYLLPVLAVLFLIILLGLANRRAAWYYGRVGRWLILGPIWVAATYLLFGLLSSFVPSTL